MLKEKEKKEKEVIELINFYKNEKNKNIKQLHIIEEEITRCTDILDDLKEQVRKEQILLNVLEGKVCAFKRVLVEKSLKK